MVKSVVVSGAGAAKAVEKNNYYNRWKPNF